MIEVAVYAAEGSGAGLIQIGPDWFRFEPLMERDPTAIADAAALAEVFWQLLPSVTFDALVVAMAAKRAGQLREWKCANR